MLAAAVNSVSKTWPTFVWRGVFALILAVVAFAYPGHTAAVLTLAFGAYILLSGVAMLVASFAFPSVNGSWLGLNLAGLVSIIAGVFMLAQPAFGALTLAFTISLWAIAAGVLEIFAAFQAHTVTSNAWLLGLIGVFSIAAGVVIAWSPGSGLIALSYTVAVYAALAGIASIVFGVRLRSVPSDVRRAVATP